MELGDKRIPLIYLLYKLDILGCRLHRISVSQWLSAAPPTPPPACSVKQVIVALSVDYLHFTPKHLYPGEEWITLSL